MSFFDFSDDNSRWLRNGEWERICAPRKNWDDDSINFLHRPAHEEEAAHTDEDGVVNYAQPQGAKAYEVALMIEALDDNPYLPTSEQQENAGPGVDIGIGANPVNKTVFTREAQKAGGLPPIGAKYLYLAGAGIKKPEGGFTSGYWDETFNIAYYDDLVWIKSHGVQELESHKFKAIDNRTEDQKLRDYILHILQKPPGVKTIIDDLLESDKFTITLSKG